LGLDYGAAAEVAPDMEKLVPFSTKVNELLFAEHELQPIIFELPDPSMPNIICK
jgi:hypothetical protein